MRILLGVVTLLLAGCRGRTARHEPGADRGVDPPRRHDHPEYVRVERAADMTGTHPRRVFSDAAHAHLKADVSLCEDMAKSAANSRDHRE